MEPIVLRGKERTEWEMEAIARTDRSRQLVFRAILDHCCGKSTCWPSNQTLGNKVGLKPRAVKYILRQLEDNGVIRCVQDMSLPSQRLIVLLGHPGTRQALSATRGGARIDTGGQGSQPGGNKPAPGGGEAIAPQVKEKPKSNPLVVRSAAQEPPSDEEPEEVRYAAIYARFFGHLSEIDPKKIQD